MPKIYRRKDGRWSTQVTIAPNQRRALYGKTRKEVEAKLATIARHGSTTGGKQSVATYLLWWLEHVKPTLRPASHERYRFTITKILPYIGSVPLGQVTAMHVMGACERMRKAGIPVGEVHACHGRLHQALSQAVIWRLLPFDPTVGTAPPEPQKKEHSALSAEEIDRIMRHEDRLHALWALLLTTGLRIGEALALQWSDLDLEAETIRVEKSLMRIDGEYSFADVKTKKSRRVVEIAPELVVILRAHRGRQVEERLRSKDWQEHDLVFCRPNGKHIPRQDAWRSWKQMLERLGLPHYRLHDTRRTMATLSHAANVPARATQDMLGHASYRETFSTYTDSTREARRDAARRMGTIIREG